MNKQKAYERHQVETFLQKRFPEIDWTPVIKKLPLIIWRSRWDKLAEQLGLPYTRKYMQNLDWQGAGPGGIKDGGK